MNGHLLLYLDQYNNIFYAHTVNELRKQIKNGSSTVHKMYSDEHKVPKHIGYAIGGHWLTAFQPIYDLGKIKRI